MGKMILLELQRCQGRRRAEELTWNYPSCKTTLPGAVLAVSQTISLRDPKMSLGQEPFFVSSYGAAASSCCVRECEVRHPTWTRGWRVIPDGD